MPQLLSWSIQSQKSWSIPGNASANAPVGAFANAWTIFGKASSNDKKVNFSQWLMWKAIMQQLTHKSHDARLVVVTTAAERAFYWFPFSHLEAQVTKRISLLLSRETVVQQPYASGDIAIGIAGENVACHQFLWPVPWSFHHCGLWRGRWKRVLRRRGSRNLPGLEARRCYFSAKLYPDRDLWSWSERSLPMIPIFFWDLDHSKWSGILNFDNIDLKCKINFYIFLFFLFSSWFESWFEIKIEILTHFKWNNVF